MVAPLILGALVAGLAVIDLACGRSEKKSEKIGPDPDTRPMHPPKHSPELPRDPRDLFAQCFPGKSDYEIIIENPGRGLCGRLGRSGFFHGTTSAFRLCFPTDPGCDLGPVTRFGHPFHLDSTFPVSYPPEVLRAPRSGAMRSETRKREEDFWYFLDGGLYDDCRFVLQLWQGVRTFPPAAMRNLTSFEIPLYARRKDGKTCTAEPDFSNEKILHLDAPLCATFPALSGAASVTSSEVKSGSDCDNRMGKTLPMKVTLVMK